MAQKLRGKWALGITPRHFTWILKDKLAICERPGGYGPNHRRVRRQEEIIWLRENGFTCAISIIQARHNLHNYEELNLPYRHRPYDPEQRDGWLKFVYTELDEMLRGPNKVIVHGEELGDRLIGIIGGYIRWSGLVEEPAKAMAVTSRLTGRQLDPGARDLIMNAHKLHDMPMPNIVFTPRPGSDAEADDGTEVNAEVDVEANGTAASSETADSGPNGSKP